MDVCVCVYSAFRGLRQNVCVYVRAWSKHSSFHHEGARKEVCSCVWGYILYKKLYLSLSLSHSSSCLPALNPFEEQENVDARFVEETALKQTLILLGFEEK